MNCGKEYEEDDEELVEGCDCGSSLFLYQQEGEDEEQEEVERDEVLQEVDEMLRSVAGDEEVPDDADIHFDLESIHVSEEGVYEINVQKLLENVPLIVEVRDSRYHLHLPSVFKEEDKSLSLKDLDKVENEVRKLLRGDS